MLVGPGLGGMATGFHSKRQALGLVDVLDVRKFENATISLAVPVRQEIVSASAPREQDRVRQLCVEEAAVEPKPELVLTLYAAPPVVACAGTHHVELSWEEPRQLPHSSASEAAKCTWSYVVEVAQVVLHNGTLNSNSKAANNNGNHNGSNHNGSIEWQQLQRTAGRTCKAFGLKPGTTYQIRLSLELDNPTQAKTKAAAEEARGARSGVTEAPGAEVPTGWRVVCVPSAAITFSTLPTPPSTPHPPSLSSRERKALKLKWVAPEEAGSAKPVPLRYTLYCKPPPAELDFDASVDAEGFVAVYNGEDKSTKVAKLKPGSRYSFKLKASNQIGDSPTSLCSTFTTQATVPSQPLPPTVVCCNSDSVVLQWSRPAENGSPIVSYRLERDDGQGGTEFQLVYAGNQLSATAKGLKHGVKYSFRLLAMNDEGKSLWSTCAVACTAPIAPSSPASPTVVNVSRTCATLSWHCPGDNGGSAVTGYQVELQPKCRAALEHMGPSWLSIFEGNALACTISSLRAGCAYRARVRAYSPAGWSLYSVPIDVVTAPGPPDAPEPPTLGIAEVAFLGVQWVPPTHNGGSKLTHYRLEVAQECPCACGSCPSPSSPSEAPPLEPCSSALRSQSVQMTTAGDVCTAEIRDLTPSTAYYFRLAAGNAVALSAWSEWTRIMTCADVPSAPTNLRQVPDCGPPGTEPWAPVSVAVPSGMSSSASVSVSASLSWEPAEARGSAVQQYVVEGAAVLGDEEDGGQLQYASLYRGPLCCGLKVKGLSPATKYSFRVAAVCVVGAGLWSEALELVTPAAAPEPPRQLMAESPPVVTEQQDNGAETAQAQLAASRSVVLSWQPPLRDNGSEVSAYLVEMSPPPPGVTPAPPAASAPPASGGGRRPASSAPPSAPLWHQVATVPAQHTQAWIPGLQAGRSYYFRVRAMNALGQSAPGDHASTVTTAAPPTQPQRLQVSSRSANGLRLRWDEPLQDHGSAILLYQLEVGTYCQLGTDPSPPCDLGSDPSTPDAEGADAVAAPLQSVAWSLVYSGKEAQAKVQGLEPHQRYLMRCRAVNAAGAGAWSAELAAETALAPPAPPQEPSAIPVPAALALLEDPGSGAGAGLLLRWKAAEEPAFRAAAIGFEVMVAPAAVSGFDAVGASLAPVGQPGPATAVAAWHSAVAKLTVGRGVTECRVDGLLGGTGYVCRVRAVGAEGSGHSGWSEEVAVVTDGVRRSARESGEVGYAGKRTKKDGAKRAVAAAATDVEPAGQGAALAIAAVAAPPAANSLRRANPAPARKAKALPPAGPVTLQSAAPSAAPALSSQASGRKQPKAHLLTAANIPKAAPRPSRRTLLDQAWRKATRTLYQHGWKLLVVWGVLAFITWIIYLVKNM